MIYTKNEEHESGYSMMNGFIIYTENEEHDWECNMMKDFVIYILRKRDMTGDIAWRRTLWYILRMRNINERTHSLDIEWKTCKEKRPGIQLLEGIYSGM
jgi:hypothetical protein